MKSLLTALTFCICMLIFNSSKAQDGFFSPTLGINFGTQGFGLEGGLPIASTLGVRVGGNFTPFEFQQTRSFGALPYNVNMKTSFMDAHLLLDWQPFSSNEGSFASKFIVSAGAGYFFRSKGKATAMLQNSYYYGDIEIYNGDVGQVNAEAKWQKVAPYAGIGLNNLHIDNKIDLGFGLGTYYLSSPNVHITGTRLLAGNESNEPQLKENLKDYKWLPVARINFNYKFK